MLNSAEKVYRTLYDVPTIVRSIEHWWFGLYSHYRTNCSDEHTDTDTNSAWEGFTSVNITPNEPWRVQNKVYGVFGQLQWWFGLGKSLSDQLFGLTTGTDTNSAWEGFISANTTPNEPLRLQNKVYWVFGQLQWWFGLFSNYRTSVQTKTLSNFQTTAYYTRTPLHLPWGW